MVCRYTSDLLISVLLCITGGQCLTVVTSVGEDVVLPCDVGNTIDPTMFILWSRTYLPSHQYVHVQRNGKAVADGQDVSYVNRTSLFHSEVEKGNVSLKLTRVKPSDEGNYTCKLPEISSNESTVQLIVEPRQVIVRQGEDVILPCQTNADVDGATVEWSREDMTPQHVGQELPVEKNPVYKDRTSVSVDRVKDGDIVSLTISAVQLSDDGLYTCFIKSDKVDECVVHLIVGSPEVRVYAEKSNNSNDIILHCEGTGFHSKDVTLDMRRDGRVLDQLDGLQSTDVRPNGDGTFQIEKHVEILRSDSARFSCELKHHASNWRTVQDWDHSELDEENGPNIRAIVGGAVAAVLLLVGVLAAVIACVKNRKANGTNPSRTIANPTNIPYKTLHNGEDSLQSDEMKELNDGIEVEACNKPDTETSINLGTDSLEETDDTAKLNDVKVRFSRNDSGTDSLEETDEKTKLKDSSRTLSTDSALGSRGSGGSSPELQRPLNEILCVENSREDEEGEMKATSSSSMETNEEIREEEEEEEDSGLET